jgi:hypothetical protein
LTAEGDAPLIVDSLTFADPPGWRVRLADPPTIADRPGNRQQWRQAFHLTPDRPGDLPLQPPAVRLRAGGRETPVEIDWRPLTVHVTTTIARPDLDEAHGVTGPEPAPPAAIPFWKDERFWAATIAVVAVTAAVLAGRRRRPSPAPEPPPHEWSAAELDRLGRSDPDADALAAVLRDFLARRFQIPAAGTTTDELLLLLCATPNVAAWRSLLERCDVARFANRGFTADEWAGILDQARVAMAESLTVAEPAGSTAASPAGEKA